MFKQFQQLTLRVVDLVNSPRKTQRIMRDAAVSRVILRDFYEALKLMDNKGFFAGRLSEASLRGSGGKFLVTPAGKPFGLLSEKEMLAVAITGKEETLPGLPQHIDWHREIYRQTNANVVMLCQPVYACLLAQKGRLPASDIFLDNEDFTGSMKVLKHADLNLAGNLQDESMFLIKGIGVLIWGTSLHELIGQLEILERMCRIDLYF